MKNRSMTGVSAELVRKVRMFSSSRTRAATDRRPAAPEVGHRQGQQVMEQAGAELDVDAVGGVGEQIGAQDGHNGLEGGDRQKADHQHVEGAEQAVHQDLVDDDLEEQRRDQAEELQEERRDQDFAQQAAILVDRAHEPADAEAARDVRQAGPAGHRDQPAVPDRDELLARHEGGPGLRRLDQHLVRWPWPAA